MTTAIAHAMMKERAVVASISRARLSGLHGVSIASREIAAEMFYSVKSAEAYRTRISRRHGISGDDAA